MKFQKYQDCGNDYIIINNIKNNIKNPKKLALKMCERSFSIGAEGVLLIEKSQKADYKIVIYEPDGKLSTFVHNAAGCAAKYIADNLKKKTITLEASGKLIKTQISKNNVKMEVGKPTLDKKKMGLKFNKNELLNEKIEIDKKEYIMSCLSLNKQPQCVLFVNDLNYIILQEIAPSIEGMSVFNRKLVPNLQAAEIVNNKELIIEHWEADFGMVYSDVNGAASAFYAAYLAGFVKNKITAHLVGGTYTLEIKDNELWKTSIVEKVFEGEFN